MWIHHGHCSYKEILIMNCFEFTWSFCSLAVLWACGRGWVGSPGFEDHRHACGGNSLYWTWRRPERSQPWRLCCETRQSWYDDVSVYCMYTLKSLACAERGWRHTGLLLCFDKSVLDISLALADVVFLVFFLQKNPYGIRTIQRCQSCMFSLFRSSDCGRQLPLWPCDLCEDGEDDEGGSGEGRTEGSLHEPAAGLPHSWLQPPGFHWSARIPFQYVYTFTSVHMFTEELINSRTTQFIYFFDRSGAEDLDQMGHAEIRTGSVQRWYSLHWRLLWIWALSHPCPGRGAGTWEGFPSCWFWEAWQLGQWPGDAHETMGQSQVEIFFSPCCEWFQVTLTWGKENELSEYKMDDSMLLWQCEAQQM